MATTTHRCAVLLLATIALGCEITVPRPGHTYEDAPGTAGQPSADPMPAEEAGGSSHPGDAAAEPPAPDGAAVADASTPAASDATVITSDDGQLVVTIPDGATPHPNAVTVTTLDGSVYGVDGVVYEIEPSGLEFARDVALSFRLPQAAGELTADDLPLVATLVDDQWVPLAANEIAVHQDHVLVTGWTDHLSPYRITRRLRCEPLYSTPLCETPYPFDGDQPFSDCMLSCMQPLDQDSCGLGVVNETYGIYSLPDRSGCWRICVGSWCGNFANRCLPLLEACHDMCEQRYAEECVDPPEPSDPSCHPQPGPFGDPTAGRIACAGSAEGGCELPQVCCQAGTPACTDPADCPLVELPPELFPYIEVIPRRALACDGSEDCAAGEFCAANVFGPLTHCAAKGAPSPLPENGTAVCHDAGDCASCRRSHELHRPGLPNELGMCGCWPTGTASGMSAPPLPMSGIGGGGG